MKAINNFQPLPSDSLINKKNFHSRCWENMSLEFVITYTIIYEDSKRGHLVKNRVGENVPLEHNFEYVQSCSKT